MLDKRFWENKRVFVTGHTGFKGSWLLIMLKALKATVAGYALAPLSPSLYSITGGANLCKETIADIRDFNRLKKEMAGFEPDIVIHMAAQPLVIEGYKNPLETFEINVTGAANVMEAARQCKSVKAFVNVTTDKVYENLDTVRGYREDDRLGGFDPYSASKACSEIVTSCYRSSYFNTDGGCGIASARAGNVIGGGDFAKDRLLPDIIRALQSNEKIVLRCGGAIRPWQHVLEPLSCYLAIAQNIIIKGKEFCTSFNIGPDRENCIPVLEMLKLFCKIYGKDVDYDNIDSGYHETNLLTLDSTKAKNMLGYRPVYNIEKTLEKVALWTKEYYGGGDIRSFTLKQVIEYLDEIY